MLITNDYKLPEEFLWMNEGQEPGFNPENKIIRVTTLIGSPQKAILAKRFGEKMDVADTLNMQLGTGLHALLEKRNKELTNVVAESHWVRNFEGWTISGTIDSIIYGSRKEWAIKDYKVTSTWTVVFENFNKYILQLNIYNWLTKMGAIKLSVNMVLRDWSKSKAQRGGNYPRIPYYHLDVPIWSEAEVETYIASQLKRFEELNKKTDAELLENVWCTEEERMSRPTKYAVMKNNNKTATAVCETADQALAYIEKLQQEDTKNTYRIEERPGANMCLDYCPVRHVCGLAKGARIVEGL